MDDRNILHINMDRLEENFFCQSSNRNVPYTGNSNLLQVCYPAGVRWHHKLNGRFTHVSKTKRMSRPVTCCSGMVAEFHRVVGIIVEASSHVAPGTHWWALGCSVELILLSTLSKWTANSPVSNRISLAKSKHLHSELLFNMQLCLGRLMQVS